MNTYKKNYFKFFTALIVCLLVRLIPFRAPNVEPILATQMPFSKVYGKIFGFSFGFFSIMLYDIVTLHFGVWSFITASAYGVLGLFAAHFFRKREPTRLDYVKFAIIGTLFFDAVTGLSIGPIFFHQSFMSAFVGQVPFTILHIVGNVSFSFILSPIIYSSLIKKKKIKPVSNINILNPKTI